MSPWAFLGAALLLALERVCYMAIARAPGRFGRECARPVIAWLGSPVTVVGTLFCGFKVLQAAVFLGWCYVQGEGSIVPAGAGAIALALAGGLIVVGQVLSLGVFYRLGAVGVFFGDRLGHPTPWCREFPFSCISHPQYVGTVLTIWGIFLVLRFPHPDWYLIPVLETVYYAVGGWLEGPRADGRPGQRRFVARQRAASALRRLVSLADASRLSRALTRDAPATPGVVRE